MKRVFIFPVNSLILYDLVKRFGHEPLAMMSEIHERVRDPEIDSPPYNITPEEPIKGLKYCTVEAPSGVRGRLALIGPLIEKADAAIIVNDVDLAFGCSGCARTNEAIMHLIHERKIPKLVLKYPANEVEPASFVKKIFNFLKGLD
ncbi:MAG: methanogenesis marker 5 protein [Candidatus Bathyarchaeota archaeon]